jgi:tripartite-type tricarboxylate transporter receptor subunit TctC
MKNRFIGIQTSSIKRAARVAAVALGIAGASIACQVQAQSYPVKPIRMIVAFPPGGTTDIIGRLVAAEMSTELGQQIVVENRSGAGGMIGTAAVAQAAADGYTVLLSSSTLSTYAGLYSKVSFDAETDFEPLGLIATSPYLMAVHPSLPVKTVAELIAYAKANPEAVAVAGSAPGTAQHLGWELFKRGTASPVMYVPYKGSGALMPDLLSGRLHAVIDNVALLSQYVKSGELRPLAVTGKVRSERMADVPTVIESGVDNFEVLGWFGLYAPANTSPDAVKTLNNALVKILRKPAIQEKLAGLGVDPYSGSSEEQRQLLKRELTVWTKVIHDAGIKLD